MRRVFLFAALILPGCGQPKADAPANPPKREAVAPLPFNHSEGFLDGYRLRVPRDGDFTWSGIPISEAKLAQFVDDLARHPHGPNLWVEFEPGVSQARADLVRQHIIDGGLCRQHRCGEVGWNVKRPVFY